MSENTSENNSENRSDNPREESANQLPDLIEVTDENGNVSQMEIIDYFFYNGQEYAIIADYDAEDEEKVIFTYPGYIDAKKTKEKYDDFKLLGFL